MLVSCLCLFQMSHLVVSDVHDESPNVLVYVTNVYLLGVNMTILEKLPAMLVPYVCAVPAYEPVTQQTTKQLSPPFEISTTQMSAGARSESTWRILIRFSRAGRPLEASLWMVVFRAVLSRVRSGARKVGGVATQMRS